VGNFASESKYLKVVPDVNLPHVLKLKGVVLLYEPAAEPRQLHDSLMDRATEMVDPGVGLQSHDRRDDEGLRVSLAEHHVTKQSGHLVYKYVSFSALTTHAMMIDDAIPMNCSAYHSARHSHKSFIIYDETIVSKSDQLLKARGGVSLGINSKASHDETNNIHYSLYVVKQVSARRI